MKNINWFKEKYFTNNFYWINEENYQIIQKIGIEMGCLNPNKTSSIIGWHEGFKNLGFRTYEKNNNITIFQKEPFLMEQEKATNFYSMVFDYLKYKEETT